MNNEIDFKFMVIRQVGSYSALAKALGFSRTYLYRILKDGTWVKYKKELAEALKVDESALKRFE